MRDPNWAPEFGPEQPETVKALIRQLAESEMTGGNVGALGVAAIVRVTTVDLLREVLPRTDAEHAYRWLSERTFAEPLGEGVTLHELVRKALRADLRLRHPEWERELRRRVADYFWSRATAGDLLVSIELAHLVESPMIRWGYSWEGSIDHRIDDAAAGDLDTVAAMLEDRLDPEWWAFTSRFFDEASERVAIARDRNDDLCGFQISVTPLNAPAFCRDDPLLGPWLAARARARTRRQRRALARLDRLHRQARAARAGDAGHGRRAALGPRQPALRLHADLARRWRTRSKFAEALGCKHMPDLDVNVNGHRLECWLLDYGPGGLIGCQRELVYHELGLRTPAPDHVPDDTDYAEAVRDALRDFRLPHNLAANPLAHGWTQEERVESVRSLIRARGRAGVRRHAQRAAAARHPDPRLHRSGAKPRAGGRRAVRVALDLLPPAQGRRRARRRAPGRGARARLA